MLIKSRILITYLFSMIAYNAHANCSRGDIDHYLSKGFTPDQVTQLCTDKTPKAPAIKNKHNVNINNEPGLLLISAIDAENTQLLDNQLSFTQKSCLDYGLKGPLGRRDRVCPEISTLINLADLNVVNHTKRIGFIGKNSILVNGAITFEVLNPDSLNAEEKRAVTQLTTQKSTTIPIRSKANMEKVLTALSELTN